MKELKDTLIKQLAVFVVVLLLFVGTDEITNDLKSVTDEMNNTVAKFTVNGVLVKPKLQDVGDAALDPLATGATMTGNKPFIETVGFLKGVFDAIEGGAGQLISFFKGVVSGHKATKAAASTIANLKAR